MGQEYDDTIEGGTGNDDIYGGHHKRFGKDANDTIRGGQDSDVVLGDNGEILRETSSNITEYPWTVHQWDSYLAPFNATKIRDTRRYDDIDGVENSDSYGNDLIFGDEGDDVLHGQRG